MQLNSFLYASFLVCAKRGNKTSNCIKMHDEITTYFRRYLWYNAKWFAYQMFLWNKVLVIFNPIGRFILSILLTSKTYKYIPL